MRLILAAILLTTSTHATSTPSSGLNCSLVSKELNLLNSKKEVLEEKYKMFVKQNMAPSTQNGSVNIKIDANNELVKAISKLNIAEVTLEAVNEMCKDGTLKTTAPQNEYNAKIIPQQ